MAEEFFKGLGRYIPPEISRFAPAVKTVAELLKPTQIVKNPAVSNLVRSPSLANLGTVLSNTAMTATEVIPGGKLITTPVKKTSKLVDDLIKKGDLKKASEITDDPLNLMAIERDRFQKLVEAKRKRGKVFEVGQEGTEGTFRYRGNTYNKADGVLIGYPGKRRAFEKNWVPKEIIGEPDVIAKQPSIDVKIKSQKKAVETKRMKNINEYYPNLQKEMLENNLTIDEAIVKLAGRDLPKGTKSYQIIDKFYRLSDDMKNVNPKMHQFFENEIKAYQIQNYLKGTRKGDKFTGEKVRFGTKEYEAARKELAEKLNIDVKFIDRAHSIMKSRLNKLSKLVDEGTITNEQAMKLSKPQYFLLNSDNLTHVKLENKLDTLLQRKASLLSEKDFPSANKVQEGIEDITKEMEELGVESELFDPVKKLIKVFGRRPDTVEIYKKAKETGIKKKDGGMVGISHLTRPLGNF